MPVPRKTFDFNIKVDAAVTEAMFVRGRRRSSWSTELSASDPNVGKRRNRVTDGVVTVIRGRQVKIG